ncbi:MAG: Spy/CpxP family protein refolding chaperone [Proteobacteria bacterium]|nr:Spy/CpxP family protein refolding chaperone [Pseudomonadota bacterium]MDA0993234.1 Spy/CpxP family protein refolding chaperone [Pseudomonadota bacterium]
MKTQHKAILSTLVALSLAGGVAISQEQTDSGHSGEHGQRMQHRGDRGARLAPDQMIEMMTRRLDLDESQTEQVSNVMLTAKPEFESLREKEEAHRIATRTLDVNDPEYNLKLADLAAESGEIAAASTELRGRIRVQVHAILTPEQQEKLSGTMEKQRARGQRNRDHDDSRRSER